MKDWLYDRIVRRNDRIRTEYERYVRGHFEEHRKKRLKGGENGEGLAV